MFSKFAAHFKRDASLTPHQPFEQAFLMRIANPELRELFSKFGGVSFNNGAYRIVSPKNMKAANDAVALAFPEYKGAATVFGYDWLGNCFCYDLKKTDVLICEWGNNETYSTSCTLYNFHNRELIDHPDNALMMNFYRTWLGKNNRPPWVDQCVGYKKPLFLGGEDEVANLQTNNLEVYWSVTAQQIDKVRDLPPGTKIGKVSIED